MSDNDMPASDAVTALRDALAKTTPGAWMDEDNGIWSEEQSTLAIFPLVGHFTTIADTEFIALAHNALPELLDANARLASALALTKDELDAQAVLHAEYRRLAEAVFTENVELTKKLAMIKAERGNDGS